MSIRQSAEDIEPRTRSAQLDARASICGRSCIALGAAPGALLKQSFGALPARRVTRWDQSGVDLVNLIRPMVSTSKTRG